MSLSVPSLETSAAPKNNSKTGFIALYNPNGGGILASIALTVQTNISNTNISGVTNAENVAMNVHARTKKISYTQCGGTMTVISPSKVGSINFALSNDPVPHWGDANYVYNYKKSGSKRMSKKIYTVQSKAQFSPTPSRCLGGHSITDNFSFNNN